MKRLSSGTLSILDGSLDEAMDWTHPMTPPKQPEIPAHTPPVPETQPQPARPEIPPAHLPGPEIPAPGQQPDPGLPGPEIPDPGPPPGPQPATS